MRQSTLTKISFALALFISSVLFQNCDGNSSNQNARGTVSEESDDTTSSSSTYLTVQSTSGSYSVYEEDDVQISVTHGHEDIDSFTWYRVNTDGSETYLQSTSLPYIILYDVYLEDAGAYRVELTKDNIILDSIEGYLVVYVENLIGECSYDIGGTKFTAFSDIGGKNNVATSSYSTYTSLSTYEENWFRIAHCLIAKTNFGANEGKIQVNSHSCEVEEAKHGYNTGISELAGQQYHDTWHLKVRCGENTISYSWYSCHQVYNSDIPNFVNYAYQVSCHVVGH